MGKLVDPLLMEVFLELVDEHALAGVVEDI